MNTPSKKLEPNSAETSAQDAVTQIRPKDPVSPLPARGNDEVMSQPPTEKAS